MSMAGDGRSSDSTGQLHTAVALLDDVTLIRATGVIDMMTVGHYTEVISGELTREPTGLVLDLDGVVFLASTGLEALISARRAGAATTTVVVVAGSGAAKRPITLTGVDDLIPLFDDVDQAVAATRAPAEARASEV